MSCKWKTNWDETRRHFLGWWKRDGLVVTTGGAPPAEDPHAQVEYPGPPASIEDSYTDARRRALRNHYEMANSTFPADNLPLADTQIGPGSLALLLGSEPGFSPETVWFQPVLKDVPNPESLPSLRFDPDNRWWRIHETTLRQSAELAGENYLVGCPDLVENLDILAALRDPQRLLFDLIERPEWVEKKIREINIAFFEAYQRIYDIIKQPDGSSAFWAFELWGPGKVAKVQCDAASMISPEMFRKFVVPALTEQCRWLDCSVFHLDGTQCIVHLDSLLGIEELDAVEWTPQAGIEQGGSPRWYDIYRRILDAGKSAQAIEVGPDEVKPLLDATGGRGMYIKVSGADEEQRKEIIELAEAFR